MYDRIFNKVGKFQYGKIIKAYYRKPFNPQVSVVDTIKQHLKSQTNGYKYAVSFNITGRCIILHILYDYVYFYNEVLDTLIIQVFDSTSISSVSVAHKNF